MTIFDQLAAISGYFALAPEVPAGDWQPVPVLLDEPDALTALVERVAMRLGSDDRSIAASILFQGWAARLTSIYAGSIALGGPVPDLSADRLRFRLPAEGPVDLALTATEWLDPPAAWRRIADAHLAPLGDSLRALTRIGRRQLWGNVASAFAGSLGTLDRTGHAPLADTIHQPWANPDELEGLGYWTARAGAIAYVRTTCCLIERIPDRGRCGDCSLTWRSPQESVRGLAGQDLDTVLPQLLDLYAACFGLPPWNETADDVAAYAVRLRDWASRESFTGLVAHDRAGALVAAAYGWRAPPEAHGVALPGAPSELPFHVADLMVHPDAQRRGLGRHLLDRLAAGRTPAMLLTHPESGSRLLYEAAGWRNTGTVRLPSGADFQDLVVYALD